MTDTLDLLQTIRNVSARRGVFRAEAYFFVMEALESAMAEREEPGHISGTDLLESIRELGTERFGVMAGDVFNDWGVQATVDFGRIVFHLVEEGLLRKREQDSLSDFIDGFDFREAFSLRVFEGEG
jgi:uncharacterized repeat protein (TIGR04138 family)